MHFNGKALSHVELWYWKTRSISQPPFTFLFILIFETSYTPLRTNSEQCCTMECSREVISLIINYMYVINVIVNILVCLRWVMPTESNKLPDRAWALPLQFSGWLEVCYHIIYIQDWQSFTISIYAFQDFAKTSKSDMLSEDIVHKNRIYGNGFKSPHKMKTFFFPPSWSTLATIIEPQIV